jgi:Domain of Unknown Function (DUF1080)
MKIELRRFKALVSGILILIAMSSFFEDSKWTSLLDKNLSQWEMYLSYRHTSEYKGEMPTDEKGIMIQPIGRNKNINNVFTVLEERGEPILKISGEIYGCVFTKQEFENYHLKLKVKWGDKKWIPRADKLKDSGIVYHSIGECGADYWRAWMLGQELQIMEGHVGDYWNIANSAIDVRAFIPEGNMNAIASHKQHFLAIGSGTGLSGFCLRTEDRESSQGEWTKVELICFGDKSLHIVNGHVVMVLQNSRYVDQGKSIPLLKGKIQLQSEGAEVYYKDIDIRSIKALPAEYASYFR